MEQKFTLWGNLYRVVGDTFIFVMFGDKWLPVTDTIPSLENRTDSGAREFIQAYRDSMAVKKLPHPVELY